MRATLGEILVHEKTITRAQLEEGLNAQVIFGGRLGTNLVELSFLDVDALSRALAIQHQVPAALQKHFEAVQPAALKMVPAKLALKHNAIPLGVLTKPSKTLAVAFLEPNLAAIDEISFAAGCRLTVTVAPELRIHYYLEKFYGISRKMRYMRISPEAAQAPPPAVERRKHFVDVAPAVESAPAKPELKPDEWLSDPEADLTTTYSQLNAGKPFSLPESVTAVAVAVPVPVPVPVAVAIAAPLAPPAPVAAPLPVAAPPSAALAAGRPALGLAQALAAIGAATSRDEIGDALVDHLRSSFGTGLVLILRDEIALGWKGYSHGVDPSALESIAVPLSSPSMLQQAISRRTLFRGAPPAEGSALQSRLWKLLKCAAPKEVAVMPVMLKERPVLLVYAHAFEGAVLPDGAIGDLLGVCSSAATAFVRLIQQSKSKAAAGS